MLDVYGVQCSQPWYIFSTAMMMIWCDFWI